MNKQMIMRMIGARLSGREPEDLMDFIENEADLCQKGDLEADAFLPWFLSKSDEIELPSNGVLELPEGFIREDEDEGVYLIHPQGDISLVKVDARDAYQMYKAGDTGVPKYYALVGKGEMHFWPKPDGEYLVRLSAYYREKTFSSLDDQESNLWMEEAPGVILNCTGYMCAMIVRDDAAVTFFQRESQKAKEALFKRDLERRMVNQHNTFGGDI